MNFRTASCFRICVSHIANMFGHRVCEHKVSHDVEQPSKPKEAPFCSDGKDAEALAFVLQDAAQATA